MTKIRIHATTIELNGSAVLIRGPSGCGKSSLALMALETSGNGLTSSIIKTGLVADDQTELELREGTLYASAPPTIAGLLEVRGQGILKLPHRDEVPLALVVDLKPSAEIERLPELQSMQTVILGVTLPCVAIEPSSPAAVSQMRVAWTRVYGG